MAFLVFIFLFPFFLLFALALLFVLVYSWRYCAHYNFSHFIVVRMNDWKNKSYIMDPLHPHHFFVCVCVYVCFCVRSTTFDALEVAQGWHSNIFNVSQQKKWYTLSKFDILVDSIGGKKLNFDLETKMQGLDMMMCWLQVKMLILSKDWKLPTNNKKLILTATNSMSEYDPKDWIQKTSVLWLSNQTTSMSKFCGCS